MVVGCALFANVSSPRVWGRKSSSCRKTWSHVLEHDTLSLAAIRLEFPRFSALGWISPGFAWCCSSQVGSVKPPPLRNSRPTLLGQSLEKTLHQGRTRARQKSETNDRLCQQVSDRVADFRKSQTRSPYSATLTAPVRESAFSAGKKLRHYSRHPREKGLRWLLLEMSVRSCKWF